MYISAENILIISVLINALLGAILSLWFRVPVFVPLVAFAIFETSFLTTTLLSATGWGVFLVCSLEVGYLVGCALGALRLPSLVRRVRRDLSLPRAHKII